MFWSQLVDGLRSLGGPVGNGRESPPEDVQRVQRGFMGLGRRAEGEPSGVLDQGLDGTIRGYQRDRGLRADGWLGPAGETATALAGDLSLLGGGDARHRQDRAAATTSEPSGLRPARWFFDGARELFRGLGFDQAARNLDRYRSGRGGEQALSRQEVEAQPLLLEAERANRLRFEAETFRGRSEKGELRAKLLGLPEGVPTTFEDDWERSYNLSRENKPSRNVGNALDLLTHPGFYFAFGETGVRSNGRFEATRKGDRIGILGEVLHQLDSRPGDREPADDFDFAPGQPGAGAARRLEAAGEAKPFALSYRRRQPVAAAVRITPSGDLVLERSLWGEIKP
jgi:hypothetical protein